MNAEWRNLMQFTGPLNKRRSFYSVIFPVSSAMRGKITPLRITPLRITCNAIAEMRPLLIKFAIKPFCAFKRLRNTAFFRTTSFMERRTFLKSTGASVLGGTLGAGSLFGALDPSISKAAMRYALANKANNSGSRKLISPLSTDLTPYTGTWGDAQLRHLLRRTMFGLSEAQFQYAQQALISMDAVVTQLLACQDLTTVPLPVLSVSPPALAPWPQTIPVSEPNLLAMEILEIENWWFDLMMQENLSIRQKMTFMWTNHFVTGSAMVLIPGYVYQYLITCMTNALGNFKTFAQAITIDPAMLLYLNGNTNTWTAKNDNRQRKLCARSDGAVYARNKLSGHFHA